MGVEDSAERTPSRPVLSASIKARGGRRNPDGSVTVRRWDAPQFVLYGPYWSLDAGTYRLEISTGSVRVRGDDTLFFGAEILVQNRTFLAVADYCKKSMPGGKAQLDFHLPEEFAAASGNDAKVEFRVLHYGVASYDITSMTLTRIASAPGDAPPLLNWRLSSRVRRPWLAWAPQVPNFPTRSFGRGTFCFAPPIKLPGGRYRLSFQASRRSGKAVTAGAVNVSARIGSRLLDSRFPALPDRLDTRQAFEFDVPPELAFERGSGDKFSVSFRRRGNGSIAITGLELEQVARPADLPATVEAPAIVGNVPVRVVIIGNCQAEILRNGYLAAIGSERVRVRYHFADLQKNLIAAGRSDLESSDVVLIQDISDFDSYPLKSEIPPRALLCHFPMLRFSPPWPFDSYNGGPDRVAAERELREPLFPNLDGVLARLRQEIPDQEARFRSYKALNFEGAPDILRLARFEERRLLAMDRQYGFAVGAYILETFRKRPIFYSVGHPGGIVLSQLFRHLNERTGLQKVRGRAGSMEGLLNMQVPIHPAVATLLKIGWATEKTRYEFRGAPVTWETYTRRYIQHFG